MTKMLERARALTRLARETAATELLARDKVELAIRRAASAGADSVTISPPSPLKIKNTSPATAAVDWLTKAGFRVRWTEHRPILTVPAGDQLEIEWT